MHYYQYSTTYRVFKETQRQGKVRITWKSASDRTSCHPFYSFHSLSQFFLLCLVSWGPQHIRSKEIMIQSRSGEEEPPCKSDQVRAGKESLCLLDDMDKSLSQEMLGDLHRSQFRRELSFTSCR